MSKEKKKPDLSEVVKKKAGLDLTPLAEALKGYQVNLESVTKAIRNADRNIPEGVLKAFQDYTEQARVPPFISPPPIDHGLASEFRKRLIEWIKGFDASLDQEHEVGIRLVNFGQTFTFHLTNLGYWNPYLISFSGHLESGAPVVLIQHVSQISILLMKLKRKDISKPKRPIGFLSEETPPDTGEKSE